MSAQAAPTATVDAAHTLATPDVAILRARLEAAGIQLPQAETVLVDLAGDPPLGASLRTIAVEEAERVVAGAGAAFVAAAARRVVIAVRDAASQQAIAQAAARLGAVAIEVERVPEVWPTVGIDRDLGCHYPVILDGEALLDLEAAAYAHERAPRRVTVVGHVARPGVIAMQHRAAPESVEALVLRAGGATVDADAWVALDGGAYGGVIANRESAPRSPIVLVLPADHALVLRARVTLSEHLVRAASACEGCRACTEACPVFLDGGALEPHAVVLSLALGAEASGAIAEASSCVACGVCNAACPGGLSPAALVTDVRARLSVAEPTPSPKPRGEPHPDRAGRRTSLDLLVLRAGLA